MKHISLLNALRATTNSCATEVVQELFQFVKAYARVPVSDFTSSGVLYIFFCFIFLSRLIFCLLFCNVIPNLI